MSVLNPRRFALALIANFLCGLIGTTAAAVVSPPPKAPLGPAPGSTPLPGTAGKVPPKVSIKKQMLMDTISAQRKLFCQPKPVLRCFKGQAKDCQRVADAEFQKCKVEIADKAPAVFPSVALAKMFTSAFMGCYGGKMKDLIADRQSKKLCK